MKFSHENDQLVIYLEGRVDSTSADQTEADIMAIYNEQPHAGIVLDIDNLEYISSAGLRVLLRLRKEDPTLTVRNASSEVYEVFEMTGFAEIIPVQKAFRRLSVDGCEVIGRGAKGTVYRLDTDTIIKVYKNPDSLPDIKNERELARKAFVLGIPTAIPYDVVRVGESYGSVFELLDAKSYSQLIAENPADLDAYVADYAKMLRNIHSTEVQPDDMPDIKTFVNDWLKTAAPYLPEDQAAKLGQLIRETPDTMNMLHCDYHTNNIMLQNGETLLIDMDTLSHGHPVFELANIYITYIGFGEVDPTVVENFIGFSYDLAKKVWETFLPYYLNTDDAARITEVENKAKLLSYLRLLRHTVRRGHLDEPIPKATVALCQEKIAALLQTVDTLDF